VHKFVKLQILAISLLFILPIESKAQSYEDLIKKLEFCRDLETGAKRLSCFETLVPQGDVRLSLTPSLTLNPLLSRELNSVETKVISPASPVNPETKLIDKRELFGAEHIPETRRLDNKTNTFQVIKIEQNRNSLYYFYMENGQVWRQLERQGIFVPKGRLFDVVITQGSFGDYKMKIENKGRQTRVKRVK
jgi:hypothetical protein